MQKKAINFSQKLIDWFSQNKKNYSFYDKRNPYRAWVSEVCLQQTRLEAAIPKLEKFLARFDSVEALAKAPVDKVLEAFAGLGYYNRARNLHKGAHYICQHHRGIIPHNVEELQKIPSIGEYTACAIASICFGQNVIAVDGNVKRVIARILGIDLPIESKEFSAVLKSFTELLRENPPPDSGFNYSEALMQMGQNLCKAKNPLCQTCFFRQDCVAFRHGSVDRIPRRTLKDNRIDVELTLYFFTLGDSFFVHQWEGFLFLNNHWGPIALARTFDDNNNKKDWQSFDSIEDKVFRDKIANLVEKSKQNDAPQPMGKHSITRYRIHVTAQKILLSEKDITPDFIKKQRKKYFYSQKQLEKMLISSIYKKFNWRDL